jgi:hypothetical protein
LARAAASSTRARGVAIRLEIKKIASFFFLFVKNLVIGEAFFFLLSLSFFGHAFYSRAATCTSSSMILRTGGPCARYTFQMDLRLCS